MFFCSCKTDFNNLLLMQDSAPPHYVKKIYDLFDTLPVGWIGHKGSIDWSPHSCDLTPMNFSVWEMMKDKVFRGKPRALSRLQASIKSEFKQINANKILCHKICNSVLTQMQKYVAQKGHQLEQF